MIVDLEKIPFNALKLGGIFATIGRHVVLVHIGAMQIVVSQLNALQKRTTVMPRYHDA